MLSEIDVTVTHLGKSKVVHAISPHSALISRNITQQIKERENLKCKETTENLFLIQPEFIEVLLCSKHHSGY